MAKEKILDVINEMIDQKRRSVERFQYFGESTSSKALTQQIEDKAVLENLLNLRDLIIYTLGI